MAAREEGREPATFLERAGSAAATFGSVGPRHPGLRLALQWGIALLIFGSLVFFVVRQWNQLPDFAWHFEPAWLVVAAVACLAYYLASGEIWRLIVNAMGQWIDPRPARAIWGKSLLGRYVPTNALMVVGRVIMAERYGVARRVCLASVVYELGLQFGTAMMVGSYFVIQLPSLQDQPARYLVLALIPAVLIALHPRVFFPLANRALRRLGREPLPRPLSFRRVLEFSLMYAGTWALIGGGLYAFGRALHPLGASDFPYVAAAYPVAFCVSVVTFIVPSGLGTRDATLAIAMKGVIPATVATAIAIAFRIFLTAIELTYVCAVAGLGRGARPPGR